MHYVRINNLKPGMISVRPLYSGSRLLLSANKELSKNVITLLKHNNFHGVYVYDENSIYDSFTEIVDVDTRVALINSLDEVDVDKLLYTSTSIIENLLKRTDLMIDLNELFLYDEDTYSHSINVAITSTACGIKMGVDKEKLQQLATAAMLHDIGKTQIPYDILRKNGKLTEEETEIMHRHAQYGYDMLYNNLFVTPLIRAAVRCHHENWDGSGYPVKLSGESIPLFARIIHVADVYDALCKKRYYKDSFKQSESIEYLLGGCGTLFDLNVVNAFLQVTVAYPAGTTVLLSNGSTGYVVKTYSSYPLRPLVVVGSTMLDLANDESTYNLTIIDIID